MGKYAPRYAQKPDSNQPEIVTALEKIGCSVYDASRVGKIPDLIVGYRGCTLLLEVKTPKGRLSSEQVEWHKEWRGHSCVVRSPKEAIEAVLTYVKNHQIR